MRHSIISFVRAMKPSTPRVAKLAQHAAVNAPGRLPAMVGVT